MTVNRDSKDQKIQSSLLITAFNRPELTKKLILKLSEYKPSRIYFAVDGARNHVESKLVGETQSAVHLIDWPCEVFTRFSESNQGCALGMVNAINWAFENEPFLIILEDDIYPSFEFFSFCDSFFTVQKKPEKLLSISGTSEIPFLLGTCHSWRMSNFAQSWGWATWKSEWADFYCAYQREDYFPSNHTLIQAINYSAKSFIFFSRVKKLLKKKNLDSWAFPFLLYGIKLEKQTAISNANLTINLGSGFDATHTKFDSSLPDKFTELDLTMTTCSPKECKKYDNFIRRKKYSVKFRDIKRYVLEIIFKQVEHLINNMYFSRGVSDKRERRGM